MSEQFPAPDDAALDEQAMHHALGTLDDAQRACFESCLGCPHSRAADLAAGWRDAIAMMTSAALPTCAPPAPQVKERILNAISQGPRPPLPLEPVSRAPSHGVKYLSASASESAWTPTVYRGVRVCEMSSASPDFSIVMIALDPGAVYPAHPHKGAEDIYLISGDASMDGTRLHPGDFMHWEPGSDHHEMISNGGCRAMMITSRKNYSPRLVRAYGRAHRLITKIGRALGISDSA